MIKIVRNNAGNCVNFVGTSNPAYWNACLSAEANSTVANNVDIINDIRTVDVAEPIYEFFNVPYTEFGDKDGNAFADVTECIAYINSQANVHGNTGRFILEVSDTLDFSLDDTSTTILLDNGDTFPVNSLTASGNADGNIDISTHSGNIIIYKGLRLNGAFIDGVLATQTLATAVNELNSLFTVTGDVGVAPVITSATAVTMTRLTSLNYEATATNGVAYEWSNLPSGVVSVNGGQTLIGGSSLNSGTYTMTLRAVNYYGFDEQTITLTVSQPAYSDTYSLQINNVDSVANNQFSAGDFSGASKPQQGVDGNSWTASGWFKPSTSTSNAQSIMAVSQDASYNQPFIELMWRGESTTHRNVQVTIGRPNNAVEGYIRKETNDNDIFNGGGSHGGWYHLTFTGNGVYSTTDSDTIKIYVNGVRKADSGLDTWSTGSSATNSHLGFQGTLNPTQVRFGASPASSNYSRGCLFDEWGWWNEELSDAEILALYNSGSTFDLMSLTKQPAHFYRFGDNDVFPTVYDNSGSCHLSMNNMVVSDFKSDVPT